MYQIIAISAVFLLASDESKTIHAVRDPIEGSSDFYLNDRSLANKKREALKGNADSAYRVYQYYAIGEGDMVSSFTWLQISAIRGNLDAQYSLGYAFANIDLFKNIYLARYWLGIASHRGSPEATRLLKELDKPHRKSGS